MPYYTKIKPTDKPPSKTQNHTPNNQMWTNRPKTHHFLTVYPQKIKKRLVSRLTAGKNGAPRRN